MSLLYSFKLNSLEPNIVVRAFVICFCFFLPEEEEQIQCLKYTCIPTWFEADCFLVAHYGSSA